MYEVTASGKMWQFCVKKSELIFTTLRDGNSYIIAPDARYQV